MSTKTTPKMKDLLPITCIEDFRTQLAKSLLNLERIHQSFADSIQLDLTELGHYLSDLALYEPLARRTSEHDIVAVGLEMGTYQVHANRARENVDRLRKQLAEKKETCLKCKKVLQNTVDLWKAASEEHMLDGHPYVSSR